MWESLLKPFRRQQDSIPTPVANPVKNNEAHVKKGTIPNGLSKKSEFERYGEIPANIPQYVKAPAGKECDFIDADKLPSIPARFPMW